MPLKTWDELLNDAGDAGKAFEPLPDGTYDFVITESKHVTSAKGKDGYNITAKVESGPYKNRNVFNTFYISPDSPAALGIFFRQMSSIGLDANFFKSSPTNEQIVSALVGKHFRGTVDTDEYQGKKRNQFTGVEKANPQVVAASASAASGAPDMGKVAPTPSLATPSTTPAAPATPSEPAPSTPKPTEDPWSTPSVPSIPTGAPSVPF